MSFSKSKCLLPWCSLNNNKTVSTSKSDSKRSHNKNIANLTPSSDISFQKEKRTKMKYASITLCILLLLSLLLYSCTECSDSENMKKIGTNSNISCAKEGNLTLQIEIIRKSLRRLQNISKQIQRQKNASQRLRCYSAEDIDYASSTHGGYTEALPGVETQQGRDIVLRILGLKLLWWNEIMPTPTLLNTPPTWPPVPGDCWPMKGHQGGIIINLWATIYLKSISILHIRPDAQNSAPKDFQLHVIFDNGTTKSLLDSQYDSDGAHWQTFSIFSDVRLIVRRLAFRILSNHGNLHHTCLYRIRVFGVPIV